MNLGKVGTQRVWALLGGLKRVQSVPTQVFVLRCTRPTPAHRACAASALRAAAMKVRLVLWRA